MRQTKLNTEEKEGFKIGDIVILKNPREWEKHIRFMIIGFSSGGLAQGVHEDNRPSFYQFDTKYLKKVDSLVC